MKKTFYECSKKERQEKISNRMVISFAIGLVGIFVVLYLKNLISTASIGLVKYQTTMLWIFIPAAVICIACYVLSLLDRFGLKDSKLTKLSVKERFRNYGHCFAAVSGIAFYLNFPFYSQGWLKIETSPVIIGFLKNTNYAFNVVFALLGAFLVFTIAYHMFLYYKKK